jgi:hypothetical protein
MWSVLNYIPEEDVVIRLTFSQTPAHPSTPPLPVL